MISMRAQTKPLKPVTIVDEGPSIDAGVKSAVRVMRVLEYFDEVQRDLRLNEIVQHLHFPQSSTSALIKSLVQTGYLDYLPATRTYQPSPRVALLGSWIGGSAMHDGGLVRMMEELSEQTGETIVLASSSGIYAKYIYVIQAVNPLRLHVPVGSRRLLAWSAMGAALMSDLTDEAIRLIVTRTNAEAAADRKHIDPAQTLANVNFFRKKGYFFSRGMVTPGASLVSMRLPSSSTVPGRPIAIGIAGLHITIADQEQRIIGILRDTVRRYFENDVSNGRKKTAARRA